MAEAGISPLDPAQETQTGSTDTDDFTLLRQSACFFIAVRLTPNLLRCKNDACNRNLDLLHPWLGVAGMNVEILAGSKPGDLGQMLLSSLRSVRDFPIDGILFKDIAPLLAQRGALTRIASALIPRLSMLDIEAVMAIDARGFVFGAILADRLEASFIMVRKPGKLPGKVHSFDYTCEYCSGQLEVSTGVLWPGTRVLVVDDVLATGGTARATADFALAQGAIVAGYGFLLEIGALEGRRRLIDAPVLTIMRC